MLAKTETLVPCGIDGKRIVIETDIANGLPNFVVIGLGDTAVKEASERVRRAVINSGFKYPQGRITVNLSPAYIYKKGSHFDLGIAMGILAAEGEIKGPVSGRIFIGELSLDGGVLPVQGVLPMISALIDTECREIILPEGNCKEAHLITKENNLNLIPVKTLREAAAHIDGKTIEPYDKESVAEASVDALDFADVKGHWEAKSAMALAMAGAHSILLMGPPGTGKTMLARRVPGILPPMDVREMLETSKIYSAAGFLTEDVPIINKRPFRHLTPRITGPQLIGGGRTIMPGEVSFAHNGILFLDEMLEFPRGVLELLRSPMEDKRIRMARRGAGVEFPADFILIGAANPCKCGYLGDELHPCVCTQTEIDNYRGRLSGPLADRIDMCVEINRVDYQSLKNDNSPSTCQLREQVEKARDIQKKRFTGLDISCNSKMEDSHLAEFCRLGHKENDFLEAAYCKYGISPRRHNKILKLSRTIADMEGMADINLSNLASAIHYTRFIMEREKVGG